MTYNENYICEQEQKFIDNVKLTAKDDADLLNNSSVIQLAELAKEEAAEFIQAISKLTRNRGGGGFSTRTSKEDSIKMVIEESSDIISTTLLLAMKLGIIQDVSNIKLTKAHNFNHLNNI